MIDVIYSPFDLSEAIPAGRRRFWKQVLPVTTINYKGQKVNFDPEFHVDLAQSFEEKAFDQVPIVFADGENRHNMDPRNFGGDVVHMEYRGPKPDQGTWALIEADRKAAKEIQRNPRLGVSARIRQAVEKADGRKFGRAIEHLCLTMNPRVTGMGPWQAVDLSEEDADIEVVDLTAANYQEGNDTMAPKPKAKSTSTDTIDLSAMDDDEFQALLDLTLTEQREREADVDEEDDEEVPEDLEVEVPRRTRRKKSKTKVTIEKDSEDDGDDDEEDEEEDENLQNLSDSDRVIRRDEVSAFRQMQIDLAEDRWANKKAEYLSNGVPSFLLDLAEPVLSQPEAVTIDLSDDETVDASATITKMLDGVKGIVDLTGELGHQIDLSSDEDSDEADKFLTEWDKQYG